MANRRLRLEARVAKLERAVLLLSSRVQECRDLGLAGRTTAEVAYRGVLEGRTGFATAQCSAESLHREFAACFERNVRKRLDAGRKGPTSRRARRKP